MLLSERLASLKTFFRTSLIKFHLKSQRMSDYFYHITASYMCILKFKGPKYIHLAMSVSHVFDILRRVTSRCKHYEQYLNDGMKSYLKCVHVRQENS